MEYTDLLKQEEWNEKCGTILKRDHFRCKKCGAPGFRNFSHSAFKTRTEIEEFLEGVSINDANLIDFLESTIQDEQSARRLRATFKAEEDGQQMRRNGYFCPEMQYELIDSRNKFWDSFIPRTYMIIPNPMGETPFEDCEVLGWVKNSYYNKLKTPSNSRLRIAAIYRFPYKISNDYIVSVEYDIGMLSLNYWGNDIDETYDIALHISYGNYYATIHIIPHDEHFRPIYKSLNIHHEYYIQGKTPWDYEDDALVCLCNDCHERLHKMERVPIYKNVNGSRLFYGEADLCDRCGGSGYIPEYSHVQNGICFQCWGEGVVGM